ncbi:hypothetical protein OE88DRAFT_1650084, partial [Heliocybe sulcata]
MTTLKVINRISVKDRCTTCPDLEGGRGWRAYTQGVKLRWVQLAVSILQTLHQVCKS